MCVSLSLCVFVQGGGVEGVQSLSLGCHKNPPSGLWSLGSCVGSEKLLKLHSHFQFFNFSRASKAAL
jgi:hypothetical protein